MAYLSQFTSLSGNYPGISDDRFATLDDLPAEERKALMDRIRNSTGQLKLSDIGVELLMELEVALHWEKQAAIIN